MAMDKRVAEALKGMGVNPKHREQKAEDERPRVLPKVAKVLESMGIAYAESEIAGTPKKVTEAGMSPLDMPGSQPAITPQQASAPQVNTKGQPGAPNINTQVKPAQPKVKPQEPPKVQLRQDGMNGGVSTLQDLSDQMNGVTASMKTIDLLIQSLSEGGEAEGDIGSNKDALRAVFKPFFQKVESLKNVLGA